MDNIQTHRYDMLVHVVGFGKTYGSQFPAGSRAGELFGVVGASVEELGEHAKSKMSSATEGKSAKVVAREALLAELMAVARTARAITFEMPELEDKFRLPDPQTDQALITAAGVFASDAEHVKANFVAHAMPETFIADLNDRAARFEAAILDRNAGQDDHTAARTKIEDALKAGTTAARKLDAIVRNQFANDRATLNVWVRDRKVGYRRPSKTKKGSVAAAANPAVASTASAAEATAAVITPQPAGGVKPAA